MTDFFENLLSNGELQKEIAELKAYKDVNEDFKTAWEELKAKNEALIEGLGVANKYVNKYHKTLQEIKAIAIREIKELTDSAINGGRYLEILDLITKAEEQ